MRGLPASVVTRRSLGEAFALCRAAARGAGLPWGMADECGRAARWLLQNHLPLEPLAALLEHRAGVGAPDPDARPLRAAAAGRALCPLLTGALLADEARALAREGGRDLDKTAWPILLAPFLSGVGEEVEWKWRGARVFLRRGGIWTRSEADALRTAAADWAAVRPRGGDMLIPPDARPAEYPPPPAAFWDRMGALAARTYVPSGEESRRGAGAGLTDND